LMVFDMDGWAYAVVDNLLRKSNVGNLEQGTRLRPGYGGQAREQEKPGVRESATRDWALQRNLARGLIRQRSFCVFARRLSVAAASPRRCVLVLCTPLASLAPAPSV